MNINVSYSPLPDNEEKNDYLITQYAPMKQKDPSEKFMLLDIPNMASRPISANIHKEKIKRKASALSSAYSGNDHR